MNLITITDIKRLFLSGEIRDEVDEVALEIIVRIFIMNELKACYRTSPHKLLELGVGYALTNKYKLLNVHDIEVKDNDIFIHNIDEIDYMCKPGDVKIDRRKVFELFEKAMNKALFFKKTGCFHVASIATVYGDIVDVVEDVSRECALYKVLGSAYMKGIDFTKSVIIMSSRASSKFIENLSNLCIPITIFRGAPTFEAVNLARKSSITLIAHVREGRANVYSGSWRIV